VGEVGSSGTSHQINCGSQGPCVPSTKNHAGGTPASFSEGTTRFYIRKVEAFARYFQYSPDHLGPQHIREYRAYLFTKRELSPGSVTKYLCALRFFYMQTLKRWWSIADILIPRRVIVYPQFSARKT